MEIPKLHERNMKLEEYYRGSYIDGKFIFGLMGSHKKL